MSSVTFEEILGAKTVEYQQYICPKCNQLLQDAVQTNCGHYLCEDCAGVIIYTDKEQARCPIKNCRKKLIKEDGTRYFPERAIRREIALLPAVCPISDCHWKGAYEDYQSHKNIEHPPALLETVPRRRASHVLVTVKDQQVIASTSEQLRHTAHQLQQSASSLIQQANNMEKVSKGAESVERVSADSLRRSQMETGASASSNKSLKRANDFGIFREARSNTLDASTANDQVRLETIPQVEYAAPTAQVSRLQGQLVAGTTHISQHHYPLLPTNTNNDDQPTSPPLLPPIPNPLSLKAPNQLISRESSAHQNTSMDASVPCATKAESVSPRNHQRKKPSPLDLPPLTPNNPIQVTSALSPRQSSSPNEVPTLSPYQASFPINPLQLLSPNIPLQAPPSKIRAPPTNVLYEPAPPTIPAPSILRARNLPVPTSPRAKQNMPAPNADHLPASSRAKSNTMPQISGECPKPECRANKKKVKVLAVALGEYIKCTGCINCNKENKKIGRERFQSI